MVGVVGVDNVGQGNIVWQRRGYCGAVETILWGEGRRCCGPDKDILWAGWILWGRWNIVWQMRGYYGAGVGIL